MCLLPDNLHMGLEADFPLFLSAGGRSGGGKTGYHSVFAAAPQPAAFCSLAVKLYERDRTDRTPRLARVPRFESISRLLILYFNDQVVFGMVT